MAGNIIIVEQPQRFQMVSNEIIGSDAIDVLTLGVYVKILHFGREWKLNVKGLGTLLRKSGIRLSDDKVRECIVKLEAEGYIRRIATHDDNNRMTGWDYLVYAEAVPEEERTAAGRKKAESPTSPISDNTGFPTSPISRNTGFPTTRKTGNTYNENDNILQEDKRIKEDNEYRRFIKPTIAEIATYCEARNNGIDAEAFYNHYQSKGWKIGNTPMKDWHAAVRTWEARRRNETRPQPAHENYLEHNRRIAEELQRQYQQADEQF